MADAGARLRFHTLAVRRELPSDNVELSPVAMPRTLAYGEEARAHDDLALALSELPSESEPTSVARLLLPEGVTLREVTVPLAQGKLPARLAQVGAVSLTVAVVPDPGPPGAEPLGAWVFVPVLDHACYVARGEDLEARLAGELAALPAALELDLDGWRRLLSWAPAELEPMVVELGATALALPQNRRSLAASERRRLAESTLDRSARRLARTGTSPLVGRDQLVDELGRALAARPRRSVLLVGEPGTGKSALVQAWARRAGARPLWATSIAELIAGASGYGEWQERMAQVLDAAEVLDAVLYFEDFGELFSEKGAQGGVDLGAAMRQHVVDGRVTVLGELTPPALDRAERLDVSLIGAMRRLNVTPTDAALTLEACRAWAVHWQQHEPHRPQVALAALPVCVELAGRYLPYRAFPGKAIQVLEELRVGHEASRDSQGQGALLGERELFAAFAEATGIPLPLLAGHVPLPIAEVRAALRQRMIGQDAAVERVAQTICLVKARLQPADKPLASLLFVGPSGVGKTELARALAAYLFGSAERMVRLDMSEYADPWAAERLFHADGRLTGAVRSQPFGVVLLDEIEKAHPAVFDLLLQVLGEARLTDTRGRTTSFHNAIIVLTSNLGTRSAKAPLGLGQSGRGDAQRYLDAVQAAFRPELLNRLDQIAVFSPLGAEEIARIAEIGVRRLAERRGLARREIELDVSSEALAVLAAGGVSPDLGARVLRRHLDEHVQAPAAQLLAEAGAQAHGGTITVRAPGEAGERNVGARLGELRGAVTVSLWRRGAVISRENKRSALTIGDLRRRTARELALGPCIEVVERLGEVEALLATASKKKRGKPVLPGAELARLGGEHARLAERVEACRAPYRELCAAEELALEAMARGEEAGELVGSATQAAARFRGELLWLITARRLALPGITLVATAPGARSALHAWVKLVLEAAALRRWRASMHLWNEKVWGPDRDLEWARQHLEHSDAGSVLVRVAGADAATLLGLEAGLHRLLGAASDARHAWVDLVASRADYKKEEWEKLPGPPRPREPKGTPLRVVDLREDAINVQGAACNVPASELALRLPEAAAALVVGRLQAHAQASSDEEALAGLWSWPAVVADAGPDDGGEA